MENDSDLSQNLTSSINSSSSSSISSISNIEPSEEKK